MENTINSRHQNECQGGTHLYRVGPFEWLFDRLGVFWIIPSTAKTVGIQACIDSLYIISSMSLIGLGEIKTLTEHKKSLRYKEDTIADIEGARRSVLVLST